ncbi:MAG: hypothetical protein JW986_07685, partial [Methanotrichaceae archaeon]|nr:hypothetical protein [Methanotrichaceae archaeon]
IFESLLTGWQFNAEELWNPLMTNSVTAAGLTLTGGYLLKGSFITRIQKDYEGALGDEGLLESQDFSEYLFSISNRIDKYTITTVIGFLLSTIFIMVHTIWHSIWIVSISWIIFSGILLFLIIYLMHCLIRL